MCFCFLVLPAPPPLLVLLTLCTMWCTSYRHTAYGVELRSVAFFPLLNWTLVNSFSPLILLFEYIHLCDLLPITAAWASATSTHTNKRIKITTLWTHLSGTTKCKTIQSFSSTKLRTCVLEWEKYLDERTTTATTKMLNKWNKTTANELKKTEERALRLAISRHFYHIYKIDWIALKVSSVVVVVAFFILSLSLSLEHWPNIAKGTAYEITKLNSKSQWF